MTTFLLTWNPDMSAEDDNLWIEETVAATSRGEAPDGRWSVGSRRTDIKLGDRALMLRQRRDKGIVAEGEFTSEIYEDEHWADPSKLAGYANVRWTTWVGPGDRLPIETLRTVFPKSSWDLQGSGVRVDPAIENHLVTLWGEQLTVAGLGETLIAEETDRSERFHEGARSTITVNRYERNPQARATCIAHWGTDCVACGFGFSVVYGDLGRDFIHVHHLRDLATLGEGYAIDPIVDLRPVCPNCHAMLHRTRPAMSIADLKSRLAKFRRT